MISVIKQSAKITFVNPGSVQHIEACARTAYRSEGKITPHSWRPLLGRILRLGHESVIEHASITMEFRTDRGVTHELVRHRLAAFTQESTRYCDYEGKPIEMLLPYFLSDEWLGTWGLLTDRFMNLPATGNGYDWLYAMLQSAHAYGRLRQGGQPPQAARSVLPNSLATTITATANLREWRHIFKLRCAPDAHPQMQLLMKEALSLVWTEVPIIFDDLYDKYIDI